MQVSCTMYSATYNPRISAVGLRTTRSLLTASARSTATGITTGMIGTTTQEGERKRDQSECVVKLNVTWVPKH